MTHDELLAKIDEIEHDAWESNKLFFRRISYDALRAVVELHKPILYSHYSDELMCNKCIGIQYPCSTIQAIEKELR